MPTLFGANLTQGSPKVPRGLNATLSRANADASLWSTSASAKLVAQQRQRLSSHARALHMGEEIRRLRQDKRDLQATVEALERSAAQASHDAQHDALTGLPNRNLLQDRFHQAIAHCDRQHRRAAVLFLDLDRFKCINDQFGHSVGDRVLCDVAAHLKATIRAEDTACRYGGDEFVLLLTDLDPRSDASGRASSIMARLAAQYRSGSADVDLSASVGAAVYPDDGRELEELVRHADAAMYRMRATGRGSRRETGAPCA